jgi:predicted transcriptional regulator
MIFELKPEHEQVLERATQSGMSHDEVLDQAFAIIREQHEQGGWLIAERESLADQIAEGFAESERGELIDAEEVVRILAEDRARRQIA